MAISLEAEEENPYAKTALPGPRIMHARDMPQQCPEAALPAEDVDGAISIEAEEGMVNVGRRGQIHDIRRLQSGGDRSSMPCDPATSEEPKEHSDANYR